ncbi:MAG TPA: GlsB/YeaQ/YmgE family stress response membrane protein [Blastocatellia bacterium]|nr:GlsB/YeaQ/YmgE family stress response membrane protein [Blastocatellia bacterium]
MFRIIVMIIVGLIAGALARLIMPGKDPMGIWMTILLGIAGSFLGGFIGNLIFRPEGESYFHPGGILLSIVGAVILLWIWRMIQKRRTA